MLNVDKQFLRWRNKVVNSGIFPYLGCLTSLPVVSAVFAVDVSVKSNAKTNKQDCNKEWWTALFVHVWIESSPLMLVHTIRFCRIRRQPYWNTLIYIRQQNTRSDKIGSHKQVVRMKAREFLWKRQQVSGTYLTVHNVLTSSSFEGHTAYAALFLVRTYQDL